MDSSEHTWMTPEDSEELIISELHMGDYSVTAYSVDDSALSDKRKGFETIRVNEYSTTVIVSRSFITDMIEDGPSSTHGAYAFGVFIGQTLTSEALRLANNNESEL